MAILLTIPETIQIAKICNYLASNGKDRGAVFRGGTLTPTLPVQIYDTRKAVEWAHDQNYIARSATGYFTVSGVVVVDSFDNTFDNTFGGNGGETGNRISIRVVDPVLGMVTIGSYKLTYADISDEILATNLASAINGYGYSATSDGVVVFVSAPFYLGNLMNGLLMDIIVAQTTFDITFDNTFG